jgi:ribokinase
LTSPAPHITVIGSINMDLVVRTPRFPGPGETILGSDFLTVPGGKGANQAVAVARMGARTAMLGRVGSDAFGEQMLKGLQGEGIDTGHVSVDSEAPSGVALITVVESGENNIIVVPGANGRLSPQDVEDAEATLDASSSIVLQLEIPLPTVMGAVDSAARRGVRVILNAAPARPLPPDLLGKVDYLIVNELEAALLTGLDSTQPEEASKALLAQGPANVVITLGNAGALLATPQGLEVVPTFEVSVVDTTAAGDAFAGAFAVALAEGKGPLEAVRRANAAGALAATRLGAQPSLPTRVELESFLEARG